VLCVIATRKMVWIRIGIALLVASLLLLGALAVRTSVSVSTRGITTAAEHQPPDPIDPAPSQTSAH